jgi:hypothetical protein
MQCTLYKIYFWKVFHIHYNLICIFICTPMWKKIILVKMGVTVNYHNLMLDRLDEVSHERVKALGKIERDKLRVDKDYNKRVKEKSV